MSYFKLLSSNLETLSGLCPCMFGATIANRIHASVALLVSKWVSIFDNVLALQIKTNTLKMEIIGEYRRIKADVAPLEVFSYFVCNSEIFLGET